MKSHSVSFQVSLNDGTTLQEGQGILREIQGELSPWQKLLVHIQENNLQITAMVLVTDDGHTFILPSQGSNPRFQPFREAQQPLGYRVERRIANETNSGSGEQKIVDWFTVAVAIYSDFELQLWVNEFDTKKSWLLNIRKSWR